MPETGNVNIGHYRERRGKKMERERRRRKSKGGKEEKVLWRKLNSLILLTRCPS